MNALLEQAKQSATTDQTVTPASFTYEPPAAGKALARFVGYIELGKRKQPDYNGKPRGPEDEVLLVFELNGKKHMKQYKEDEPARPTLIYEEMTVKLGDKANFKKLFNKMRGGREDIKHMAHLLNEPFLLTIEHNVVKGKDGKPDRTYANIKDKDGSWLVGPPSIEDPMSGEVTVLPVPEAITPLRLLLWDNPTKEQWDSLFVDGERTIKDKDGNEKTVSNNRLQQKIVKEAINYDGSPLQDLIEGLGGLTLDDVEEEEEVVEDEKTEDTSDALADTKEETKPDATTAVKEEVKEEEKPAPKPKQSVDDVFADLGIDI
jgi:hypothetical protein